MGKIKRGGYTFIRWKGDHDPPHVHIYKDENFIGKIDLRDFSVIEGDLSSKVMFILIMICKEGKL